MHTSPIPEAYFINIFLYREDHYAVLFVCLLVLFIFVFDFFFFLLNHFPFRIKLKYPQRLVAQMVKNLSSMQETRVRSLGWDNPLENGMATHSSILAWRIPWAEEPGGLQSMGSQSQTQQSDQHIHTHLLLHSAVSRGCPTLSLQTYVLSYSITHILSKF